MDILRRRHSFYDTEYVNDITMIDCLFYEFDVMSFVHDKNCKDAVREVLFHLFPDEGEFTLYDSLPAKSTSLKRVREMDCISYLMLSLLHQSGYYEHKGIEVRMKPFKGVHYVRKNLSIKADGIQCGFYMVPFVEFILDRNKEPWKIHVSCLPLIRAWMAHEVFANATTD
ncbi:hypothetical protein Dsin_017387 [Dipteronia sinensis]|uniref:Uncharacterized protein n=1 Tax=Dipteronia sinensis TaxID=43782 RepID=A0AAE0AEU5_9ROSI|nr:hypothetical protein Dsin_017387 [Dipteronia sinensis]